MEVGNQFFPFVSLSNLPGFALDCTVQLLSSGTPQILGDAAQHGHGETAVCEHGLPEAVGAGRGSSVNSASQYGSTTLYKCGSEGF